MSEKTATIAAARAVAIDSPTSAEGPRERGRRRRAPAPIASAVGARRATRRRLRTPELYLNRELTWLQFNFRVLNEARDKRTPLLERVKFLAIAAANMDEFFMKRIGGLKQQIGAGVSRLTLDGRTPAQQLQECRIVMAEFRRQQRDVYQRAA